MWPAGRNRVPSSPQALVDTRTPNSFPANASKPNQIQMTSTNQSLRNGPAWKALESHYSTVHQLHLRQLFAGDPKRRERLALEAIGLYLDDSKNRVREETLN